MTVAVLTVLTWPLGDVTPRAGLDPSWSWALHVAFREHLRFGPQVAFTYGPWGFVGAPVLVSGRLLAVDLAFTFAVHAGLVWLVYWRLRTVVSWPLATVGAYVAARIRVYNDDTLVVLLLAVLLLAAGGALSERVRRYLPLAAGAVSAFALLVKFNSGLTCLVMTGAYVAVTGRRDWRPPVLAAFAAVVTFVGGWLAAGQRLGDISVWTRRSESIAAGYSEAMAGFHDGRHAFRYELLIVAVLALAVAFLVVRGSRFAVAVIIAPAAWAFFKHAAVRFNMGSLFLGAAVVVLVLPLRPGRIRWAAVAAGLVPLVAMQLVLRQPVSYWLDPAPRPRALATQLHLVVSGAQRERVIGNAARDIAIAYKLTPRDAALLSGHRVHVDPYDTSALLALGATWDPVPVFQTYSAYTPLLDDANAAALSGPHPPEYVLRHRLLRTVDGRYALFDSPAYLVAMACHYRQVDANAQWQVLAYSGNRCGQPHVMSTLHLRPGETAIAPAPADAHSIVYARITVGTPLLDRLATAAARPLHEPLVDLDGATYRFVLGTADQPLMLRPPAGEDYLPPRRTAVTVLRLSRSLGDYTVRFYEVPVTS